MAMGLTGREQWALLGVVGLILIGLGLRGGHQHLGERSGAPVVTIQGQGRWEKLADYPAGERPPGSGPATQTALPGVSSAPGASGVGKPALAPVLAMTATSATLTALTATSAAAAEGGVDLNQATAEDLDRIPGIGPARARDILALRRMLGAFSSIEQLDQVPGIGPKTLEKIRPYVRLGATGSPTPGGTMPGAPATPAAPTSATQVRQANATQATPASVTQVSQASRPPAAASARAAASPSPVGPININRASAEELDQIKGIGPVLARRIIADRQLHGPYRRPEDLIRVLGIGPKTYAKMRPLITMR